MEKQVTKKKNTPGLLAQGVLTACVLASSACASRPDSGYTCPTSRAGGLFADRCSPTILVDARAPDNPTGVSVSPGQLVSVELQGDFDPDIPWQDLRIRATPESGWAGLWKILEPLARYLGARHKGSPMSALTCEIGQAENEQYQAAKGPFKARGSGELSCFANDWPGRYENNSGCIRIRVCVVGEAGH